MNREEYKYKEKELLAKGYNIFEVDAILSDDVRKTALASAYNTGDLSLFASLGTMYRRANAIEEANTEVYNDDNESELGL